MSGYDDFAVGDRAEFGTYEFTAERIREFAGKWDPQFFHVDEEAARNGPFGRLSASGWHTAAVMMRLQVDYFLSLPSPPRFGPSPGFDDLKWLKPVYAGDRITYTGEIVAKRLSRSRPGIGIVSSRTTGTNQDGARVYQLTAHVFMMV